MSVLVPAGYIVKQMGLPLKLVAMVNSNDIVHRTVTAGDFSMASVTKTLAPAIDIQVKHNVVISVITLKDVNLRITENMTVDIFFNRFDWNIAEGNLLFLANALMCISSNVLIGNIIDQENVSLVRWTSGL